MSDDKVTTVTPTGTYLERYPVVTKCPACGSVNGYQSFDIWVCVGCNEWSGIEPIERVEIDGQP